MLKKENPRSRMRHELLSNCTELDISSLIIADITECMLGKTDEKKEELAKQLLEIISTSSSEKEMIERAKKLR